MITSQNFSALILAGGKSLRYGGENKALIALGGKSILSLQLEVLKPIFSQIIVVGNRNEELKAYSSDVLFAPDLFIDFGPLAGIYAGLIKADHEFCFVFSCDMPFLNASLIKKMINIFRSSNADILLPSRDGKIEPLFAVYSKNLAPLLKIHIENREGNSIRSFVFKNNFEYLELDDTVENSKCFYNINSKIDLMLWENEL